MIARQHRFHGYNSLNFVYRRGEIVRNPFLSLKFIRNSRQKSYRVAIIVSRKVQKSAVVRNRIRRRLYALIQARQAAIVDPYDMAFSVFSSQLAELPIEELNQQLDDLLHRAGIIGQSSRSLPQSHAIVGKNKAVTKT